MLELRPANLVDAEAEWRFVAAMPADENGFTNDWPGVSREEFLQTALPRMLAWSRGAGLPAGFVPETFLFLWDKNVIVGQFRVRHHLTEALRAGAGHIGYYIAPEFRGRGYASAGLRLALDYARTVVPEDEFYLRVNRDNLASLRVMQKNGGRIVAEDEEKYYVRIKKGRLA